ncbi:MAG TPA: type II toxin-antitoxin system VapB family antitoxin [Chloroflexota bacterium]|nr:type II toxin-antitoxin system VapB family antitoxin [Chloroflexota bacterium]
MKRRTTIEIDDELLERARRALGSDTTRATVEEALRLAADAAEAELARRAVGQRGYLKRLASHVDVEILNSDEMWR